MHTHRHIILVLYVPHCPHLKPKKWKSTSLVLVVHSWQKMFTFLPFSYEGMLSLDYSIACSMAFFSASSILNQLLPHIGQFMLVFKYNFRQSW